HGRAVRVLAGCLRASDTRPRLACRARAPVLERYLPRSRGHACVPERGTRAAARRAGAIAITSFIRARRALPNAAWRPQARLPPPAGARARPPPLRACADTAPDRPAAVPRPSARI